MQFIDLHRQFDRIEDGVREGFEPHAGIFYALPRFGIGQMQGRELQTTHLLRKQKAGELFVALRLQLAHQATHGRQAHAIVQAIACPVVVHRIGHQPVTLTPKGSEQTSHARSM